MDPGTTATGDTRRDPAPGLPVGPWDDRLGRIAIRSAQLVLVGAAIVLAGRAVQELWFVVVPVLLACIVAAAAWPLVRWFRDRGVPAAISAFATLLLLLGILTLMGWVVVASVYAEWDQLRAGALDGLAELERLVVSTAPVEEGRVQELVDSLVAQVSLQSAGERATAGALAIGEVFSGLLLLLVVAFFLLKDGADFGARFLDRFEAARRRRVRRAGVAAVDVLGGFVRGTAIVALVDTVLIGAALLLLGVPLAVPLAVLVFLGAFVPIVGATVAGAVAALVALVTNGPVTALIVVLVVVAVNQLEGDLLAPVVLGNAVSLHPLAVLLAIATGFILAGVLGALLSVPLLAAGWTIAREWRVEEDTPAESVPADP